MHANSNRSAISKALTDEAGRGNLAGVEAVLERAQAEGTLREELIRAGIRIAARRNHATVLKAIIEKAQLANLLGDDGNTLRIGLQDACKAGQEAAVVELLRAGARTDLVGSEGSPALHWAVTQPTTEQRHVNIARILLSHDYPHCPADTEWRDKDGYTALISAAIKGHEESVKILLQCGADVNAKDRTGRTILHIVAAANASDRVKWNDGTADAVLSADIDVNAKDGQGRTALHWAASTSKEALVKQILSKRNTNRASTVADPNCRTSRGKTALHLACAGLINENIIDMLIRHGADVAAVSDGGWTCLHYAASVAGGDAVIGKLVTSSPSLLNSTTSTGATVLHVACQAGQMDSVVRLLQYPECKTHVTDSYDCTPLLRAASGGHSNIVRLLAPHNNPQRLSQHAVNACQGFDATIVDMRMKSEHKVLVQKKSVFDVLYARDTDGGYPVTTSVRTLKHPPDLRWINLPANNMAWIKALLTKAFIEDGATDVEAYRAMEKIWRQQHRGPRHPFMRPLCERAPRRTGAETPSLPNYDRARADHYASSPERLSRQPIRHHASRMDDSAVMEVRIPPPGRADTGDRLNDDSGSSPAATGLAKPKASSRFRRNQKPRKPPVMSPASVEEGSTVAGASPSLPANRIASFPISELSNESQDPKDVGGSNTAFIMPYLHYETDRGRRKMQDAVKQKASRAHPQQHDSTCADEALVYAYLGSSLHLRRTLDQFWLHGVETETRDEDQVVGRWCREKSITERLFMVDQLWLFVLGPKLVITACPQRWQQPKRDDPLDLVEGVIQDVSQFASCSSVYDFVSLIVARASGVFDRHISSPDLKFMDMFEASIGNIADNETKLYSEFYHASALVHRWLKDPVTANRGEGRTLSLSSRHYPVVVDQFLDIGAETSLLQEVKDIRDELAMLSLVLTQQRTQLPLLHDAFASDLPSSTSSRSAARPSRDLRRRFDDTRKLLTTHLSELRRMTDLSEVIETSLLNLLDLKQKQANAFEARFARDQAAGTVRQGQIVMVFTMVTIVFLPMSFLATFFDIPIVEFQRQVGGVEDGEMGLGYVVKWTVGVGLAISVLLILVAFSVERVAEVARRVGGGGSWGRRNHQHDHSIGAASTGHQWDEKAGVKSGQGGGVYSIGRFSQDIRKSVDERSVREVSSESHSLSQRKRRISYVSPV